MVAGNLTKDNAKIGVTYNGKVDEKGVTVYTKANDKVQIDAGTIISDDSKNYTITDGVMAAVIVPTSTPKPTSTPVQTDSYDATTEKSKNVIKGLVSSYKKGAKATFTVVGAGLEREPKAGDTAYVPVKCLVKKGSTEYKVDDLVVNSEGEYEGTMVMNASEGNYTLVAYYELREWSDDTTSWRSCCGYLSQCGG